MILTDIKKKNFKKISNFQNNWGLKTVVKNAFQTTQAEIALKHACSLLTLLIMRKVAYSNSKKNVQMSPVH